MRTQQSIPLDKIQVNDGFWSSILNQIQDNIIPYMGDILEDKIPVTEKSHAVENFRIAAGEAEGDHYGRIFQDSDVAKWLEAASYSLISKPDSALEARLDEVIRLIGKAQQPDGYLNTYFMLMAPERKWTNLRDDHELYCAGHMIEAGVAHYKATGKKNLLDIVCAFADNICAYFGPDNNRGIPGHEEIELAMLRLYRVTGKQEYLDMAKYFIDERGKAPNFFVEEGKKYRPGEPEYTPLRQEYNQSHLPVREQKEAVGHSVRALYLYAAMADMAAQSEDKSLYDACCALMDNILEKKLYITGGLGSTFHGEAFSPAYDLPNDTTYSETCASIAMCFFARRMLELKPSGEVADVLERMLFNVVLASMQLDGKRFFYVNPLEVIPGISEVSPTHRHVKVQRPDWYSCACCPPNLARLILSLGQYAWGEGEDTIYAHFFLGSVASFKAAGGIKVECKSNYPRDGSVVYNIDPTNPQADFRFAIHIPAWCKNVSFTLNGAPVEAEITNGYAYIKRTWQAGDVLEINSELPVLRIYSNLSVSNNAGHVCLQRGPVVYCFEEEDNGAQLAALSLPADSQINVTDSPAGVLSGMKILTAQGLRDIGDDSLYTENRPKQETVSLQAVPYYAWGNRKPGEMRVWIRE